MPSETEFDLTAPATFQHWVRDTVRFSDQDETGHVNNVSYGYYVEAGRVGFKNDAMPPLPAGGRFIVARVAINYRREGHYPGVVDIGSRITRIGNRSFTLGTGIFKDGVCLATAESVSVFQRDGAAAAIDGPLREAMQALLHGT